MHIKNAATHKTIEKSEQECAVYLTDLKLCVYGAQRLGIAEIGPFVVV